MDKLTEEEIKVLSELARDYDTGKKVSKVIVQLIIWLGGGITAVVTFLYYFTQLIHGGSK